jgi:GNAT superfamily N-acetyltransferase
MSRPTDSDDAVVVRAFEAQDEPGVLGVLGAAFGQWPRGIEGVTAGQFFRWKHVASPFGRSSVLVAEADGAVVGVVGYMTWLFNAGEQILTTMRGVDFAVHPSYHRRGVSFALAQAAVNHFPSDLAFVWGNPNQRSTPVSLKSGWRDVGRLPRFVRPYGPLRETVRRAYRRGSTTPPEIDVAAASAAEILRDGEYASMLLAQTKEPVDRLVTARDLGYLRWRYGQFEEYRAVRAEGSTGNAGMAIFKPRRYGSFWLLDVCELLVAQNDRRTARHLLHQVSDAAPADFLSCSFHSRRHAALHGFVPARHEEVLVTYPIQQELLPDSTRRASWALSRGDLELL